MNNKRWLRSLIVFFASILICLPLVTLAARAKILNLQVLSIDKATRVIVTLSQPAPFHIYTLTHPHRLVLDVDDAQLTVLTKNIRYTAANIKAIRSGFPNKKTVRIVFDLLAPVKFDVLTPPQETRIVFDAVMMKDIPRPAVVARPLPVAKPVMPVQAKPSKKIPTEKSGAVPSSSAHGLFSGLTENKPIESNAKKIVKTNNAIIKKIPEVPAIQPVKKIPEVPVTPEKTSVVSTTTTTPPPVSPKKVIPSAPRTLTVVIDAGHGGKDAGAIGLKGTKEKNVVLAIARQFAALINKQPGMRAVLTRKGDYFVRLRDRLRLARKGKADIFISIHADSYYSDNTSGASVYALSENGATNEAARWLAQTDNHSELGGVDFKELNDQSHMLRSVLIDMAQTATITDSLNLGKSVLDALDDVTALHYSIVEQAPFVVLKSLDIPSILVETGFISNPSEEAKLRDKEYQNKIAQALFNGVRSYMKKYFSPGN